ncbi:polysaccharide deacetylase [Herbihabitans rhizosphaerae]|uniref:Polysaccharide deacetylase n=1 Tax=Herbihabitans rhizosphaerae TaxID=1872711 RepID=A0A4Q7KP27_9PSEU|nr:polysaccharide deacetylase family protein [Herbihabitans rhizosphaerae]RZS36992.1 polysaccharide deacetylase [Herbihabitans rhizosphaerae]
MRDDAPNGQLGGPRRRWGDISLAAALTITFTVLVVIGTYQPEPPPATAAAQAAKKDEKPWLRKLAPGEKPPQFVLFSFDGAGSHSHWQRVLPLADRVNAKITGFLSGTYLLTDLQRTAYTGPGHPQGHTEIGFGGTEQEVRTRVADINEALERGHEIGTHYNGHFCKGSEPSVGRWTTEQWTVELDQFYEYVREAPGLQLTQDRIKGGRTPCLEGKFDQLFPALLARGMTYDSSRLTNGIAWPSLENGVWEFWMPIVRVPAMEKRVVLMDYNLWYALNKAKEAPNRTAEFTKVTLDTYRAAYDAALAGNRAPLVIGNHFNEWAGGAFSSATEQFMAETCVKPDTVCATYSDVIQWMELQDPVVLDTYRKLPNAQT